MLTDPLDFLTDTSVHSETHTLFSSCIKTGKIVGCCARPSHNCIHPLRIDHLWKDGCTVPVILHCGLLEHGGVFLLNGKDSLACFLVDNGFDVWIPHTRGAFPLPYELLSPKTKLKSYHAGVIDERAHSLKLDEAACWEWGLDEIGRFDIPATTEYIFHKTHQQVVLIGHSQGAAACVAGFHFHSECMQEMVRCFVGLAPAFVAKYQDSPIFETLLYPSIPLMNALGKNTYFGSLFNPMVAVLSKSTRTQLASLFVKTFFGWDVESMWNEQGFEGYFTCTPTKTSLALVIEWLERSHVYGAIPYNFGSLGCTPLCVFGGKDDKLVDTSESTKRLFEQPGCNIKCWKVFDTYRHMDVLWGKKVTTDLFNLLKRCIMNEEIH